VRASVGGLTEELAGGNEHTEAIIGRTQQMAEALGGVSAQLADVPASLVRVETQAVRTHKSVAEIAPAVAAIEASSSAAVTKLQQAEDSMARQHELLEASGTALATYLIQRLGEVEEKLRSLRELGGSSTVELGESIGGVRDSVADLTSSLIGNRESTEELAARASQVGETLAAITAELDERLPASLARVEEQATRTRSVSAAMLPDVEAVQASAEGAAVRLAEAEASLSRQQQALDAMLANLTQGVATAEEQLRGLGGAAQDADSAASQIVTKTGPELIMALLRVREAANVAAERARETIAAVIPQSAAALAEASRVALAAR
jgi:predicted  nucleic acid-binding Zn-ribbon protein